MGFDLGYDVVVEKHLRREPKWRWPGEVREPDPKLVKLNKEMAEQRRADEFFRDTGQTPRGKLGGFVPGGAIDAKEARRKELDNWLETGRITIDDYNQTLESENLSDVAIVEHQKAKMKPLLSVGFKGGFVSGLALLGAAFIVWKIID